MPDAQKAVCCVLGGGNLQLAVSLGTAGAPHLSVAVQG